jgi:hypothetical protein
MGLPFLAASELVIIRTASIEIKRVHEVMTGETKKEAACCAKELTEIHCLQLKYS